MNKVLFDAILEQILLMYKISKEDLYEQSRVRDAVHARQLLFYMCKTNGMSVRRIQKLLKEGGFEMAEVNIYRGIKAMEKRIIDDLDYKEIISEINSKI